MAEPKPIYAPIPARAMGDKTLTGEDLRVLMALAAHDRLGAFDATENFGSANFAIAGYKIYNSSPANHTIDMNDNNANALVSGCLRFS